MCEPNKNQRLLTSSSLLSSSSTSTMLSSLSTISSSTSIEMSRHHPRGMLDRDQRTTISVLKKTEQFTETNRNNLNNKINYINNEKCDILNNNRSEIYLSKSINNIKFNNNNNYLNTNTLVDNKCKRDRSVLLNINKNHKKNILSVSKNINIKCYSTRNQTKFSSILFRVCFWLLILQKARANPIMADPCDLVDKVFRQAKIAYDEHLKDLDKFAEVLVNENHVNAHRTWLGQDWDGLQPPNEKFNFSDYTEIPDEAVEHLGRGDRDIVLENELRNFHNRLQRIRIATNQIMGEHDRKKTQHLIDNVYTGNENYYKIKSEFYLIQEGYLAAVIKQVEDTLGGLKISYPTIVEIEPHDLNNTDVRDWVVTREHLKLLQYIMKACKKIKERC